MLSFHYNSPEAQASLKHLALKQFHPKKRLIFYINKVNGPQPVSAPKLEPPPKSIIERSGPLETTEKLLGFVIHKGANERFEQRTFKQDTTVKQMKDALALTNDKASQVIWNTSNGEAIGDMNDNTKISQIKKLW